MLVGSLAHSGKWRGVLCETADQPHLVDALHRVSLALGRITQAWPFDRMATVCHPATCRVTTTFAQLAKYYRVQVAICPSRRGNRKGVVDEANHSAAQRWWRTLADEPIAAQPPASLDAYCAAKTDTRKRVVDQVGTRCTVAELAGRENLAPVPVDPAPAILIVARQVPAQAPVAFRGNCYSVPPQLTRTAVAVSGRPCPEPPGRSPLLGDDWLQPGADVRHTPRYPRACSGLTTADGTFASGTTPSSAEASWQVNGCRPETGSSSAPRAGIGSSAMRTSCRRHDMTSADSFGVVVGSARDSRADRPVAEERRSVPASWPDSAVAVKLWKRLIELREGGHPRSTAAAEETVFRFYIPLAHMLARDITESESPDRARRRAEVGLAKAILVWPLSDAAWCEKYARSAIRAEFVNASQRAVPTNPLLRRARVRLAWATGSDQR